MFSMFSVTNQGCNAYYHSILLKFLEHSPLDSKRFINTLFNTLLYVIYIGGFLMTKNVELFSGMKRFTLFATLFAFVCIPMQGFPADANQGAGTASITDVAKKATPAVVSINVKFSVQNRPSIFLQGQPGYQFDEPYDFFNDKFLQEFFGSQRKERSPRQRFQTGQASGFIVSHDGYVLTNAHVVQNAEEITVLLTDGKEYQGKVIGADTNTDVAVVKIDGTNLPFLSLGNSDSLEVGQWVVAIGNPLGLQTSVTAGVVSAKGRNNLSLARVEDFIQTDASINRGNSGGPLLSLNSEVIGMNTAIVTNMSSGGYMGIGFAIPSNIIHHIMEELIATGSVTRGFMGVSLQQINNDLAQAFGLEKMEGALVSEVSKNSPAEIAGIKQGDVIVEYNNKRVDNIAMLRNSVSLMKPGSKVTLTLLRGGKKMNVSLTIGTNPDDDKQSNSVKESKLGIEIDTLTPEMAKNHGYINLTGAVIKSVKSGSPASLAGLRAGSLIVAVNHKEIKNSDDFRRLLSESDEKKPVLLLVKQGEYMHFVSIKVN
jgi:serine protease Do